MLPGGLSRIESSAKKPARMKVVDVEKADGTVYTLRADYAGLATCAGEPCHHVKLGLDDLRRVFAPTWE